MSRVHPDTVRAGIGERMDALAPCRRRAAAVEDDPAARRRLALYDRARLIIVSNPAIMGGMPTIQGSRITAQSILGRLESGDSVQSVIEDYPFLDRDAVEAAALYAKANPPRGRPGGKLWRSVQELGLRGASYADILARAIVADRIIVTGNADDFRRLGTRTPAHPGLAVMLDAAGRAQQLTLGIGLANAIDSAETARGHLFEIDSTGAVRDYKLP